MSNTAACNAKTIDELDKIWLEVVVVYCPKAFPGESGGP